MRSRVVNLIAWMVVTSFLLIGAPSVANASGTADYLYKCHAYGTQNVTFTIPKGTRLTVCDNAQIQVLLNGSTVERYYTNDAGMRNHYRWLKNKALVQCIFAVGAGIYGVRTASGVKRIITNVLIGSAGAFPACRA